VVELTLRPLAAADVGELRRIRGTAEVARWWGPLDEDFPLADDPDTTRLVIEVDGAVAGLVQYGEELDPMYRHASIDVFLDPALRGRGHGAEAVRRVALHLVRDRGHHRISIDPAAANTAAIRAYAKVDFKPVGVRRGYERDLVTGEWHDGLLMDLLAEDL
jgi:aminoglycoside 6'-N-acetyltransferase